MTIPTRTRPGGQTPPSEEFTRLAGPFRTELLALCYRMLGSVDDAEDAVQDTYLRAWHAYDRFDGRSSLRTWLYRIATRACLRSMERAQRRPLPSGLAGPTSNPAAPVDSGTDVPWLQPFPTALLGDPATVVEGRASMRLALIAALQHLPPRQRVVLILRDVLDWRATEAAELLDTTTAAVNSLLQRARATLDHVQPDESTISTPTDPELHVLLDRYATAFTTADVDALVTILTNDATWEMPPFNAWYRGRHTIGRFLRPRLPQPGHCRMIETSANGQPAFACYHADQHGAFMPHALHVLTVTRTRVMRIVAFMDPHTLDHVLRPAGIVPRGL
ncbi:sigma-70 family RNA polymerase sigma factor [Amycolatopsis nigrescens]|uniref:sigma-70 family RNA polymerase sigma factor n=1 Tax=Amycolatopsis nigrescens TaxID=381445 RepID=UPI0003AA96E5|nr:sigma-70 family RNA polymerase sigma factor [Amycolatopsis nigrescens]